MNDRLSGKPGSFFSRVCAREEAREKVFRIWLRRTVKAGCLCKEVFGIFRLIPPASVCLNPPSRYKQPSIASMSCVSIIRQNCSFDGGRWNPR